MAEIALGSPVHQTTDFGFGVHLGGAVFPLDHRAKALALCIENGVGCQRKRQARYLHLGLVFALQRGQQTLLMRRVLVEHIEALALDLAGVEMRQSLAQSAPHYAASSRPPTCWCRR